MALPEVSKSELYSLDITQKSHDCWRVEVGWGGAWDSTITEVVPKTKGFRIERDMGRGNTGRQDMRYKCSTDDKNAGD